jgi:hypothetical protein
MFFRSLSFVNTALCLRRTDRQMDFTGRRCAYFVIATRYVKAVVSVYTVGLDALAKPSPQLNSYVFSDSLNFRFSVGVSTSIRFGGL